LGQKLRVIYIYGLGLTLLIMLFLVGCEPLQAVFQDPRYLYENGAVLVGGNDQPIELTNKPNAANVSYAEVLSFISRDPTDQREYIARGSASGGTPFVCSDFAEIVHNNAESAGIRTGYMTIDFTDGGLGHAIDAFETTDQGIVYIDCTGQSIYSQLEENAGSSTASSWDKVAYVETGKKYGVISLEKAQSPGYDFYEQFELKWQEYKDLLAAYNNEVKQYNLEISGKVYRRASSELAQIQAWETRLQEQETALDNLADEVGNSRYKPLGVVKSFTIHW
jgi:hypothetical protein